MNFVRFASRILLLACVALVASPVVTSAGAAQPSEESAKLAGEVQIADVHFHLERHFSVADTVALLDRNNVRWAGAVGPIGPQVGSNFRDGFIAALGDRYIPTLGQPELNVAFLMGGVSAIEDADSPMFRSLLNEGESEFKAGRLKGFGELFVNTLRSNPSPKLRRKIRADAPTVRALYLLAGKYGGFLQIHMEMDRDSLEQLGTLLSIEPKTDVIMSHGGVTADAQLMRELMTRHSNIYWELSQKAPPVWRPGKIHKMIFDESGVAPDWLKLIEDFPDRFMIGTDAYCCDYSQMIATYRKGLLPRLSPPTLRKVAYENAQRVMKLK